MSACYGIDLGTCTSAVAYVTTDGPAAVPCVASQRGISPSEVCVLPGGQRVIVGARAREARAQFTDGSNFFSAFKRDIGSDISSKYIVEGQGFDPVVLSSFVLRKLAQDIKDQGRSPGPVVITYPQHFGIGQKSATREAAKLAGLEVVGIFTEPFMAAVNHGFGFNDVEGKVMIFDLGGGTLDVTVVDVAPGRIGPERGSGDPQCGGNDFDAVILRIMLGELEARQGLSLADATDDERFALEAMAEKAKRDLQSKTEVKLTPTISGRRVTIVLGRELFLRECLPLLQKIQDTTERALSEADVTWADLKQVVMVGGSSRLLAVQEFLRERVGERLKVSRNPDLDVAFGAAKYAFRLQQGNPAAVVSGGAEEAEETGIGSLAKAALAKLQSAIGTKKAESAPTPGLAIIPCYHYDLCVRTTDADGNENLIPMITAGTQLPTRIRREFYTQRRANQLAVRVVEQDSGASVRRDVGELLITGIQHVEPGTAVVVVLEVDTGGGVQVSAEAGGKVAQASLGAGTTSTPQGPRADAGLAAKAPDRSFAVRVVVDSDF